MELVIDANVLISALISPPGKSCELIFFDELKLSAPELILKEFLSHKQEIINKSKLSEEDVQTLLSLLISKISIVPFSEFSEFLSKAKQVCPDEYDIEYFALALRLNCPVWSNDKDLKAQTLVKIYSTHELIELLKSD